MTEPDDLERRVPREREADTRQRVGVVEHQRVRRQPLDVARDPEDKRDLAQRMRQRARPSVLSVGVDHPVRDRDLPVLGPRVEAGDLHRVDDEVGAGERLQPVGRRFHLERSAELLVRRGDPSGHRVEALRLDVHQRERRAVERLPFLEQPGDGWQPELGARGADHDDLLRRGHRRLSSRRTRRSDRCRRSCRRAGSS